MHVVLNFFRSLGFTFFVIVVSGYTFYEYQKGIQQANLEQVNLVLVKFSKITKIKIKDMVLKKHATEWELLEPIKDRVDASKISDWVYSISKTQLKDLKVNDPNWKEYYLDTGHVVSFTTSDGEDSFTVSHKPSFDGKPFVRKGNQLLLADKTLLDEVNNKGMDFFRSKKIVFSYGNPQKIYYRYKKVFNFMWKDNQWNLMGYKFKLNNRVNRFWTDLSLLEAHQITGKSSFSNLKKYDLLKPAIEIHLIYDKQSKVTISMSFQNDMAYILNHNRKYIVQITKEEATKLLLEIEDLKWKKEKEQKKKNQTITPDVHGQ